MSFYVTRRGSLRVVSTCFYMAILAFAVTGKLQIIDHIVLHMSRSRESGGDQSETEHLTGGCFKLL